MKLFTQSATILLSMLAVLAIISTPLSSYMAAILGFIIIFSVIFIIIRQRANKGLPAGRQGEDIFSGSPIEVGTVIVALMLAVFLTGGLGSNLFFLIYFLFFGIVFLFEPATVFILLIALLIVFYQSLGEGDMVSNLIKLGSFALLSFVSYFFGREFARREKLERKIDDKTGQILEDAEVIRKKNKDRELDDEIEDIEEKANELRSEE